MIKTIRGLSLWQPWASLMAVGAKMIETRNWTTNYRGLVAIHAAKKWDEGLAEMTSGRRFREALFGPDPLPKTLTANGAQNARANGIFLADTLPRGGFIALGRLHRVLSTDTYKEAIPSVKSDEFWFGDYSEGRFMWVFDGVWQLINPVYSRGHQRLWKLDDNVADVVMAMLPDGVEEQILVGEGER